MKKRIVSFLLVFALLIGCLPLSAAAAGNKILQIPWDKINRCGHQAVSGPCQAYCWAYCRIILDNRDHDYTDYYKPGKGGVAPASVGYEVRSRLSNQAEFLKAIYNEIKKGRPPVITVNGSGSNNHYVTCIGYRRGRSVNNLTPSDILILNPASSRITPSAGSNRTYSYLDSCTIKNYGYFAATRGGVSLIDEGDSDPTPTPTPPNNDSPTLSQGSKGAKVREMQQLLKNAGETVDVDGDFGPKTRNAVISFQKKAGLTPDGICGPNTWAALRARGQKTSAPSVSVNGQTVDVSWSFSGSAPGGVDVYLLQEPWGWYDIKYSGHTTNSGYTFYNVQPGYYQAFTVVRPNADNVQSAWTPFTVKAPHTTHTWNNGTVTKPSTEEEEGIMTYTCTECGVTKTEPIVRLPHIEHRWDEGIVVKEPTETEPGLKVYTCTSSVCNETMEEEIPPLNSDTPLDPTPENDFIDIPNGAYFAKAVNWAVENNITVGTGKTTFSPNSVCTRAQAVTFLWRYAGSPEPSGNGTKFNDVKSGSYYEKAVCWAAEKGITGGVSANRFAPDDKCTRAQIVSFLYRMKGNPSVNGVSPFIDVPQSLYYANAVAWAVESGVTMGTSATLFSPHNDCSRGQIVTFLYRAK